MKNEIFAFATQLQKAKFGTTMMAMTEPKMNKTNNPYWGRVRKITYLANIALGCNYDNVVRNRIVESGGNKSDWTTQPSNGKHWLNFPFILQANKSDRQYLRTMQRANTTTNVVLLLDGKVVTNEQTITDIKSFFVKRHPSKKQTEAGIQAKDQVNVFDYGLEGILAITSEGKEWHKEKPLVEWYKQYFG